MNNSMPPKVSVCIPVYNGSDYIAEAIQSVLSQTYEDFSLIVSDNCSTDNTEEIVRSFGDPRLTFVRNPKNLGLVGNANRCLELADGEYVCILHHDDIMLKENLERKVRLLDKHQEVGFVHSNIKLIDTNGEVIAENIWNKDSRRDYIEDGLSVFHRYVSYLPYYAIIFIGAILARRSCYEHLGGFCPELPHCNDSEMNMRMLLFYNVACISTPLIKYRVHLSSASSSFGDYFSIPYLKEHYKVLTVIFDKYQDYIPQAHMLKRRSFLSFGERAINFALIALINGDFIKGKAFFKEAIRFSPWIFKNKFFWKALAGLILGPKALSLYQTTKKNIKRK